MKRVASCGSLVVAAIGAWCVVHVVACSGSGTPTGFTFGDGGAKSGDSGAASEDGGSGANDEPTAADRACATDIGTCAQCCLAGHQTGGGVAEEVWLTCTCSSPGACATECAQSECSEMTDADPAKAGDACDVCMTKAGAEGSTCSTTTLNACKASADCIAWARCIAQCQ
jgi:hypothetical protein